MGSILPIAVIATGSYSVFYYPIGSVQSLKSIKGDSRHRQIGTVNFGYVSGEPGLLGVGGSITMELSKQQMQVVGLDKSDLCTLEQGKKTFLMHKDAIEPFRKLQHDASVAGFDMEIVSAYRDFSRQLSIWNAKARGERAILDANGSSLDFSSMNNREKLYAILRWSAIPGTSRHHWGSDIDIFDARQIGCDEVQLLPQEIEAGGPCAAMHEWLTARIACNASYGFFRPYASECGGVAPEMWHLSYLPVAKNSIQQISPAIMLDIWQDNGVLLLDQIEANIADIWNNYISVHLQNQPEWVTAQLLSV